MLLDPKKGKYSDDENETIIKLVNIGLQNGQREREIIKGIANTLNRGYAGIMSHVRKLRAEFPDRFTNVQSTEKGSSTRLNSWNEKEEEIVIEVVNQYLGEGKPLSAAIVALEEKLSRTQGAIYQRIYTLRRKQADKFQYLPEERPRKKRKLPEWQTNRPVIRNLDDNSTNSIWNGSNNSETSQPEEVMIFQAFEARYGRLVGEAKEHLVQLIRQYGSTRVSIELLTLNDDKAFPSVITDFLAHRLQRN